MHPVLPALCFVWRYYRCFDCRNELPIGADVDSTIRELALRAIGIEIFGKPTARCGEIEDGYAVELLPDVPTVFREADSGISTRHINPGALRRMF